MMVNNAQIFKFNVEAIYDNDNISLQSEVRSFCEKPK